MGNENSGLAGAIVRQLLCDNSYISYENAAKYWKHISYFGIVDFIDNKIARRLLKSHDGPLSTCQLSWLKTLVDNPYDKDGLHLLYTHPNLKELFLIKGLISDKTPTSPINDDYEGDQYKATDSIYDSFPELKTPRDPTNEETVLLCLYDGTVAEYFAKHDTPENHLLMAKHLMHLNLVNINSTTLTAIVETTKAVNLNYKTDNDTMCHIFKSVCKKIAKFYCSDNDLPKETWADVFKYLFVEPFLYETFTNYSEFTPYVFMNGSLRYLLGYPEGSDLSDDILLGSMKDMFSDLAGHQQKIRQINLRRAKFYVDNLPYSVSIDETDEKFDYPPVELVFGEKDGKLIVHTRKENLANKVLQIRLSSNEFLYQSLVPTDELTTVTELLDKMKKPSYALEFFKRVEDS